MNPKETHYVVCTVCGTRWELLAVPWSDAAQPRQCRNAECDAGWTDLPAFRDKTYADLAASKVTA